MAGTQTAAMLLAMARPGLTVVARGDEAAALAPLPVGMFERLSATGPRVIWEGVPPLRGTTRGARRDGDAARARGGDPRGGAPSEVDHAAADMANRREPAAPVRVSGAVAEGAGAKGGLPAGAARRSDARSDARSDDALDAAAAVMMFKQWGLRTLGEIAALPAAALAARMGAAGAKWQSLARGEDVRPLVPARPEERFDSSIELEWPIEGLEPLSFVLTRLLEPLSTRLERRDRGAAVLHVLLHLVTRETYARRLELPTPMRDVRALRTLALLDLETHPAEAAIDRVTIVIDPTPGRVVQHTLYARAQPTPEQLSTLLARLGALMGQDRFGAPATIDTDRPGAFAMAAFATEHDAGKNRGDRKERRDDLSRSAGSAINPEPSAISHQPLMSALRRCRQPVPARVAVAGGRPARVTTDRRGFPGGTVTHCAGPWRTSGAWWEAENLKSEIRNQKWDRDEWDVSLSDGAVYRVFREADRWFIDAIVD
jgi:protein ImuB